MPKSSLHLLSLPREVRNIIYAHISPEANLKWSCCFGRYKDYRIFDARVSGAPCRSLLLTCTAIHYDYLEAPCLTDSALLLGGIYCRWTSRRASLGAVRIHWTFAHIRHATVYVDWVSHKCFSHSIDWLICSGGFGTLDIRTAKLSSFRVALRSLSSRVDVLPVDLSRCLLADSPGKLPPAPPRTMVTFSLYQVAQGSHLDSYGAYQWILAYSFGRPGERKRFWSGHEALAVYPSSTEINSITSPGNGRAAELLTSLLKRSALSRGEHG
jgi:hypothetical protein